MTVLSRSELERMRSYTRPDAPTATETRRLRLKALSDDKVKNWPNTLEAMRKKKENWKQERMAEEETARREIDRQEAALQKTKREAAISRAKTIMYEQTDKVKNLRSQQMYSDVLYEREEQIKERAVMESWEKEKEEAYHADVVRQIAEGELRETQEAAARKLKATVIARSQKSQLNEYRENYLARLRTEKRDGELIQDKAKRDMEEDERVAEEKLLKAKLEMREMQLANQKLKKLKFAQQLKEQDEETRRKRDLERKEYLVVERQRMEKARFDARQATKQKLIDKASEELRNRIDTQDKRLEDQVEAMRKKENDLEELKQRNITQQKAAIDISRQQQLEARLRIKEREEQEIRDMVATWKAKNIEIEEEEANDAEARRRKNREIRATQETQIKRHQDQASKSKADQLAYDEAITAGLLEDDLKYRALAAEEIVKAQQAGRATYMLEKARTAKNVTLLPATGSRI